MLKLIKYEFRRNRTGLAVMFAAALLLYLMAPLGRLIHSPELMSISLVLLTLYCFVAYAYVLIRGVAAYSSDLNSKSGYLMMMAPRSTLATLCAKLLFTLTFALVMLAACVLACIGSGTIFAREFYNVRGMMTIAKYAAAYIGIDLRSLGFFALYFALSLLIGVISVVSMGYLAATLAAAIAKRGRGAKFLSVLIFLLLAIAVGEIAHLAAPQAAMQDFTGLEIALKAATPALLVHLGFAALFTCLSAALLKRRVCL